jgi:hypothetical protein
MKEVDAKFICVDYETENMVRSTAKEMGDLTFIGVGDYPVEGAVHIKEMLDDDGSCEMLLSIYFLTKQRFQKFFPRVLRSTCETI